MTESSSQLDKTEQNELLIDVGDMVQRGNAVDKRLINVFRLGSSKNQQKEAIDRKLRQTEREKQLTDAAEIYQQWPFRANPNAIWDSTGSE